LGAVALAWCSARPGNVSAAEPLKHHTLAHGGLTRSYHVIVPAGYSKDQTVPLVIAMHGGGGTGDGFPDFVRGQFEREADRRGWLVVLPDGVDKGWVDGRDATADERRGVDDVAFIGALIDQLARDYAVDEKRVYATGISNGGFMSIRLALDLSDRIAAVAPVTANLQKELQTKQPTRPVPILFINGTEDPMVPYNGGVVKVFKQERGEILSTYDSAVRFAGFNGCKAEGPVKTLPDWAKLDGTRVHVHAGEGCIAPVVVYRIQGGGHTWPGGRQYLPQSIVGRVSRDINAAKHIFDFFAPHALP
jgi:polyhydroxybutyrate depolymerase